MLGMAADAPVEAYLFLVPTTRCRGRGHVVRDWIMCTVLKRIVWTDEHDAR